MVQIRGESGNNLADLCRRIDTGAYRALPSRRKYIPKADGRQRPLGIAALEDKIVQAAVVAILTPIYEAEFLGFSYGFRPRRNQHQALDALAFGIGKRRINWILDADIQSFFDTVSQEWLIRFIEHRVGDRRVVRLIRKWLAEGVFAIFRRSAESAPHRHPWSACASCGLRRLAAVVCKDRPASAMTRPGMRRACSTSVAL